MSIVNYSVMRLKIQSTDRVPQGFMLMELVMGISIFIGMITVAYSYMGMSIEWRARVIDRNTALDAIISSAESSGTCFDDLVQVQKEVYTPHFVRSQLAWNDSTIPSVQQIFFSYVNKEGAISGIELQTAY